MRYNLPAKLACQVGRGKKRNHSGATVRLFNAVSVQKNESKWVSYYSAIPKANRGGQSNYARHDFFNLPFRCNYCFKMFA